MRKTPGGGIAAQVLARLEEYLSMQLTQWGCGLPARVCVLPVPRAEPSHTWPFLLPGGLGLWWAGFSSAAPHQLPVPVLGAGLASAAERNLGTVVLLPHSLFYYS